MVTCIGKVRTQEQVEMLRQTLAEAEFADGRLTAGPFGNRHEVGMTYGPHVDNPRGRDGRS
jgi:predicted 2-oxoglutarate/Fe(II)-dependent dioxygenase YbiX